MKRGTAILLGFLSIGLSHAGLAQIYPQPIPVVLPFAPKGPTDLTGARTGDVDSLPLRLRFDPLFILEAVARRMNVALRPEIPFPEILLESTTSLGRFQNAIELQWGFRPHVFANAYAVARNEIYLINSASYYARLNRTLDDSLAHEFAHYIQSRYLNADLAHDACEFDAIAIQEWFRGVHTAFNGVSSGR